MGANVLKLFLDVFSIQFQAFLAVFSVLLGFKQTFFQFWAKIRFLITDKCCLFFYDINRNLLYSHRRKLE